MKDHVTISTFELFKMSPDQEAARLYLEGRIWAKGVKCPACLTSDRITTRKGGCRRMGRCDESPVHSVPSSCGNNR